MSIYKSFWPIRVLAKDAKVGNTVAIRHSAFPLGRKYSHVGFFPYAIRNNNNEYYISSAAQVTTFSTSWWTNKTVITKYLQISRDGSPMYDYYAGVGQYLVYHIILL